MNWSEPQRDEHSMNRGLWLHWPRSFILLYLSRGSLQKSAGGVVPGSLIARLGLGAQMVNWGESLS